MDMNFFKKTSVPPVFVFIHIRLNQMKQWIRIFLRKKQRPCFCFHTYKAEKDRTMDMIIFKKTSVPPVFDFIHIRLNKWNQ